MIRIELLEKDDWVIISAEKRYGQVKKDQKRDSQDVTVKNAALGSKVYLFEDLEFVEKTKLDPICPKCGCMIDYMNGGMCLNPTDGACGYSTPK